MKGKGGTLFLLLTLFLSGCSSFHNFMLELHPCHKLRSYPEYDECMRINEEMITDGIDTMEVN